MRNARDVIDLKGRAYLVKDSDVDRLLAKVEIDETTGCWNWTAYLNRDGYGMFRLGATTMLSHRSAYLMFAGPIPQGLEIDHLCRNRACCNPDHLEAVTGKENVNRSPIHPGVIQAAKTHCIHGHEFTPENTYTTIRPTGTTKRACRICRSVNNAKSHAKRLLEASK